VSGWKTQQQRRDAPSKVFLCGKRFFMPEKTVVLPGKTERHLQ
uniref:Uncharacterized protein n=1 Tax=Saimiri boliviensis boliviensis TaxID=39432 RepID=A0A2K6UNP6_SAIBB